MKITKEQTKYLEDTLHNNIDINNEITQEWDELTTAQKQTPEIYAWYANLIPNIQDYTWAPKGIKKLADKLYPQYD